MSCKRLKSWRVVRLCIGAVVSVWLAACAPAGTGRGNSAALGTAKLQSVDLNNLVAPKVNDSPVSLSAAKNEWTSFQIQVSGLPAPTEKIAYTLRLQPLNLQSTKGEIAPQNFSAYQVLSMPVDVNRAGYVRHTGLTAATRLLPRALVPMPLNDGRMNLSAARDPSKPTDPNGRAGTSPVTLWVDLHIPPESPAGAYSGVCQIIQTGVEQPIASLPVRLNVYDFVMPDERHLNLVGQLDWEQLQRLYPTQFEAITPRFLNRTDPRYAPAIKTLDQLEKLAQAHRVQIVVPRLQPSVKWPTGRPPLVTWDDFDSVVGPWLKGDMFADKTPLGYWPLPACDGLYEYDPQSRREYWSDAATHFDQNDWLARSPASVQSPLPGRATAMETVKISADAASILNAHPRVRVVVPLEDDQLQFSDETNPTLINPRDSARLVTATPGVVFATPIRDWPAGLPRPQRWMRTDLTGLIPYVGAGGDQQDVRLWTWLSFLPLPPPRLGAQYGAVQFIRWNGVLPTNQQPNQPADPNELLWCYPGSWFGLDEPVPTIQLKWLRRAQQDFEYLYLAKQRGDQVDALLIARLMAKPVELQANQALTPDPTFRLMPGTADPQTWDRAMDLIARRILLHEPGQPPDPAKENSLNIETLQWIQPQEEPVIMGRATNWSWNTQGTESWVGLQFGIDIYNASDSRPDENSLKWTSVPEKSAWRIDPHSVPVPALATYRVRRYSIDAQVDPERVNKAESHPVEITFTNGFTRHESPLRVVLPVAPSVRREGMLQMDGSLLDWSSDDAIQDGPMVQMLNRPAVQSHQLQEASTPAQIYTGWADANFYLAFKLTGLTQSSQRTARNFVSYQFRRAWGEDLCQLLIQPVYADNSVGPMLHVACKPNGGTWIERKVNDRMSADPWQAFEGTGLRYVATVDGSDWRGEIAIPWKAINAPDKKNPVMLRFNFTQHVQDTGESASWAGPIDFGRDDAFTGVLLLKESQTPGMRSTLAGQARLSE